VECVQTDNGFEFTNRFSPSKKHLLTLFEATAVKLHIRHKIIRPYPPGHNGKVEHSHNIMFYKLTFAELLNSKLRTLIVLYRRD
jgi:hypothetical protein